MATLGKNRTKIKGKIDQFRYYYMYKLTGFVRNSY